MRTGEWAGRAEETAVGLWGVAGLIWHVRLLSGLLLVCMLLSLRPSPAAADIATKAASPASGPTYARDIRPILQARCVVCHNRGTVDNTTVSGGLALDSYAAMKRGVSGQKPRPVIAAGRSRDSALYARLVASSPSRLMPKGGPALPAAQISLIKQW